MNKIYIKPLSVNRVWRGRRFKTKEYSDYEKQIFYLLPKLLAPQGKLHLSLEFGHSSKGSDIDNSVKPFVDILQKTYCFNDNKIYKMDITKVDVKKGGEYIAFELSTL